MVIGLPGSGGGVNATLADVGPVTVTDTPVGAPGFDVAPTNDEENAEYGPVPSAFVARTRHVYVLPAVRVVTTRGLAGPDFDAVIPPSLLGQDTK